MVEVLIWLGMGGFVGWMTSGIMRPQGPSNHGLNIGVGMGGAGVGGWFVPPWLGMAMTDRGVLNLGALLVALVSAIVLLAIVNLFQREEEMVNPQASIAPEEP